MPITEYREIRFDIEALRCALNAHLAAISPPTLPPAAQVGAIAIASREPVQLRFEVHLPGGKSRMAVVEATELAAVLIRECLARKIKLPRQALKTLRAFDGGVALLLALPDTITAKPLGFG
ncbi:hypothetical protein [Elioraea thermophila]|uniref:hypothetical protein n=1 Tax=Elioraea thermophila TaxID=2185104 RepID=UPI000DF210C9|nr:hypothetical protein [Elioraea thermophila]